MITCQIFDAIADKFAGVTEETLAASLERLHQMKKRNLDTFHLPGLPVPPDALKGIRAKAFSYKRWLMLTSDGSVMQVFDLKLNNIHYQCFCLLHDIFFFQFIYTNFAGYAV